MNNINHDFFLGVIIFLLGIIGYFLQRILRKVDKIETDVTEIKPKVQIMWEIMLSLVQGNDLTETLKKKFKS